MPSHISTSSGQPPGWAVHKTEEDAVYYFNRETKESSWEHPTDEYYRFLYKKMQGTGYPDLASFGSASAKRERLPAAAKGPGRRSRPATVSASGR